MKFHVYVHPNPGQKLPKVWAGCPESKQVAFGSIGRNLALRQVDKDLRLTREAKRQKGYIEVGSVKIQNLEDLNTLSRLMKTMHLRASGIRCEHRFVDVMRSLSLELGYRCSIEELDKPAEPLLITDGFRGPVIEDVSHSWF